MKTTNTLSEKALVVNLQICQWTARKYDRKVTAEVNKNHNAVDAGRFNKILIAQEHLKELSKQANAIRTFHYDNTLVWGDNGDRLLPTTNYFQYIAELSKLKNQFEATVKEFINDYPALIAEAKVKLNGLFNENDYPHDISDKFRIKSVFMPIPETSDFRVSLSDKEVDGLRTQIEGEMNDRISQATNSIYQRIKEQLEHMHERLKDTESVFRDTLFTNLKELIDLLPRLNITEDKNITALCAELKSLYTEPDAIRSNDRLRKETAMKVENLLQDMSAYFA